jgi:DNA processing protein
MSPEPRACPDCLRRSWLLSHLAPYIEKIATGAPGSRSPELLRLSNEDLAAAAAPKVARQILTQVAAIPERRLIDDLRAAQCWACCRHDSLYPIGLRDAADAPWALIGRGDPALLGGLEPDGLVTVVGARRASSYGREIARELGRELAAAGIVVVSGLAFGIDACAHRGALDAGRTVAVLGCGVDTPYPAAHRSLWRRICERGLVLSEQPPGAGVWRWTFPARNRIMAALAGMTVVVEAAERSGSLITADLAADLGRDLGAVPGPVSSRSSAGPNNLLAGGACLVRGAQDVLDAMLGPGARRVEKAGTRLDSELLEVLGAVERGEDTCDAIAIELDLSGPEAASALSRLEMLGYVSCSMVGVYSRTLLQPPGELCI